MLPYSQQLAGMPHECCRFLHLHLVPLPLLFQLFRSKFRSKQTPKTPSLTCFDVLGIEASPATKFITLTCGARSNCRFRLGIITEQNASSEHFRILLPRACAHGMVIITVPTGTVRPPQMACTLTTRAAPAPPPPSLPSLPPPPPPPPPPRLSCLDVRTRRATHLPNVLKSTELREQWIVRHSEGMQDAVRLGVEHISASLSFVPAGSRTSCNPSTLAQDFNRSAFIAA